MVSADDFQDLLPSFSSEGTKKTKKTPLTFNHFLKNPSQSSPNLCFLPCTCRGLPPNGPSSEMLKMLNVGPQKAELPGIQPLCLHYPGQKTLDILISTICILMWRQLSASACPHHLIISARAQTHVSLLKSLRSEQFVRSASTFWQARSVNPCQLLLGGAVQAPAANSRSPGRGQGGSWVK